MIFLVGFLYIFFVFFVPFLIVGFWRSRPVWALIVASMVFMLTSSVTEIVKIFQAMMIYGEGDPELMAGGISEVIVSAIFGLPVFFPLLILFQWLVRRHFKKKAANADGDTTVF